jgi:hypothetical protein
MGNKGKIVREADGNPRDYEQSVQCSGDGCNKELYVMPPASIRKRMDKGVQTNDMDGIEAGMMWSQVCPWCDPDPKAFAKKMTRLWVKGKKTTGVSA